MQSVIAQDMPARTGHSPAACCSGRPGNPWLRRGLLIVAAGVLGLLGYEAWYVLGGSNFHAVAPGQAYRSAQPSGDWLRQTMREHGIRTVINLRGDGNDAAWYVNERQAVGDLGGTFDNVMLSAAFAPHQRDLQRLVRVLDAAPKPVLFHCRGGADRSGFVAVIYLLLYTDTPMAEARQQLSWRFGHVAWGRSACLQDVIDQYEAWLTERQTAHHPDQLREWIRHVYRKAA